VEPTVEAAVEPAASGEAAVHAAAEAAVRAAAEAAVPAAAEAAVPAAPKAPVSAHPPTLSTDAEGRNEEGRGGERAEESLHPSLRFSPSPVDVIGFHARKKRELGASVT
jgi:hypothetical protein